jgi:hypothetical protein
MSLWAFAFEKCVSICTYRSSRDGLSLMLNPAMFAVKVAANTHPHLIGNDSLPTKSTDLK